MIFDKDSEQVSGGDTCESASYRGTRLIVVCTERLP